MLQEQFDIIRAIGPVFCSDDGEQGNKRCNVRSVEVEAIAALYRKISSIWNDVIWLFTMYM